MQKDAMWQEYRNKERSAEEAVSVIKSGDWVYYSHFAMFPIMLDRALARRVGEMENVRIHACTSMFESQAALCDPDHKTFTYYSTFMVGADRRLTAKGLCYHVPGNYQEKPSRVRKEYYPHPNVVMVKTTPMDKHGFFNFGPACSYIGAAVEKADTVIVEVSEAVPRCLGGHTESVHLSHVDYIVEGGNDPLAEVPPAPPTSVDTKIAENIMPYITSGACLQLGIGAVPNTIGQLLASSDIQDLGVHSEMMCNAFLDLYNLGKISNRYKYTNRNKIVYTFSLGTGKLYEFLDDNLACATFPVDYTNSLENISANNNMISINNALQVDLYGQVCSGALATRTISGSGGQLDFTVGAAQSEGGKSFICLHSTRSEGDKLISRIVPIIQGVCTVPRSCIHYVVTEYGVVCLKGKSTWEIAEAMISLAHPDFRDELTKEAEQRNLWHRSNKR